MHTLKQLAASATALKRRYSHDIFYAARVKILFYIAMSGVIITLLAYFFVTNLFRNLETNIGLGTHGRPAVDFLFSSPVAIVASIILLVAASIFCIYILIKSALYPISETFKLQKRFVSGIAHELRTPLSVLRINNELARLSLPPHSPLLELFDENIMDIDRINQTLNTLLQYDRLLSTNRIQFSSINIQKTLIIVTSRLSGIAKQKHLNILLSSATTKEVIGNQTALEQAFFNVIENAIEYSPAHSNIVIGTTESENAVTVSIKDNGVGIPSDDIEHIFEPFYRSEKTGKLSGIGIGLAVVEQVIRLHQGTVTVTSVPGDGTEFLITLPLAENSQKDTLRNQD